ncbi:hypothetical protein D9757_002097 [Collybiopsis confluens]|uniref:Uncharacterized protein n=1 Tax=Collybiopsis confluens TaxID=2823264 RepID=A0A8H5MFY3_9AGAR|nr:hypothetical protein D9757_002097 [Collybiopsis confluens]
MPLSLESTKPDERNEEVEGPDDDYVEGEKEEKSASPEVGHRVLRASRLFDTALRVTPNAPLPLLVRIRRAVVQTCEVNFEGNPTRTVIRPLQRADRIRPVPPRNKTSVAASAPSTSKSTAKGKGKGKASKATLGSGTKQEYHPKAKFIKDVEGVSVVGNFLASDSFVPEETDLLGSRTQYTTGPDMLLRMPHFQIDKSLMALGGIIGRNGFNMSVGDIQKLVFPLPKPACMENGDQLGSCLECVRAGKDDCDYQRPQSRCRNCQTLKLQCSKTLDLEKGLDVMNVTLAHFRNAPENAQARFRVAKDLRQALDLAVEGYTAQGKLISFLAGQFLDAFNEFKATMDDPLIVLKSLAYSPEDPVAHFSYDQFALLATIFKWNSKLNFSEVDTGDKTLFEWLEHSKSKALEPLPVASTSGGPSNTMADLFSSDKRTGDVEMEEQDDDGEGEDELAEGLATSAPIVGLEASLAGSPSSENVKSCSQLPTGTPLFKRETGKATDSGPSQSKKRKVDKVDHQGGDQSQTLLDQDTDMADAPVVMARGHKSDVIPADLRSETDRGRNSLSVRDGLATSPHKNPAALAYLTHRLWSLVPVDETRLQVVEMYCAQLPKWCHYLAKLPVELVDITKTQLEQERYGRWKRCGPKPRHSFHERRCDCENFSPERVRLVVDSLRAIPSSSFQRLERTNPVSIQLLDEVAQTSIGEFSELPTGALHATHIPLVHHNRAITSNRICEDAFKVLSNRANYADGKDDESNSMDVQGGGAAVHIPSSKDVEIPGQVWNSIEDVIIVPDMFLVVFVFYQ